MANNTIISLFRSILAHLVSFLLIDMTAYLMYQNTMRESFRTENPGMTFGVSCVAIQQLFHIYSFLDNSHLTCSL